MTAAFHVSLFLGQHQTARAACTLCCQTRRAPEVEVEVALAAQARDLLGRLQQQQAVPAPPVLRRDRHVADVRALLRRMVPTSPSGHWTP